MKRTQHDIYASVHKHAEPDSRHESTRYWAGVLRRHRWQNFFTAFLAFLVVGLLVAFTVQQYMLSQQTEGVGEGFVIRRQEAEANRADLLLNDQVNPRDAYLLDLLREQRSGPDADPAFTMQWLKDVAQQLLEGEGAERQQRIEDALEHYENVLAVFPAAHTLHARMGLLHLHRENYVAAAVAFERSLEADRPAFGIINNLAAAYAQLGRTEDAEKYLKQAIEQRPTYAPARYNLATLYAQRGEGERAAEQFLRYLELEPENLNATLSYAAILLRSEAWAEALPVLMRAAELSPRTPPIQFRLAQCYAQLQKPHEAIRSLEEILTLVDPRQVLAWISRNDFDAIRQHESFQDFVARLANR